MIGRRDHERVDGLVVERARKSPMPFTPRVVEAFASTIESTSHTAATLGVWRLREHFSEDGAAAVQPITQTTTFSLGEPFANSGARAPSSPSPALGNGFHEATAFHSGLTLMSRK